MIFEFTIDGTIPGGKNNINITRSGHRYPNKKWAMWRDQVVSEIMSLFPGQTPKKGRFRLFARYWANDARRRDVPAMIDSLFHVFEKAGLVEDDSHIKTVEWIDEGIEKNNGKVIIRLEEFL